MLLQFWCKYPMTNFMLRKRYFHSLIDVSNTVQEALFTKKPVVALETAVVSHGMPYPYNKEVAIAVEEIVKQQVHYSVFVNYLLVLFNI